MKHLEICEYSTDSDYCICETDGIANREISAVFGKDDAQYIVKACNMFPELVEALEELQAASRNAAYGSFHGFPELQKAYDKSNELLTRAKQ